MGRMDRISALMLLTLRGLMALMGSGARILALCVNNNGTRPGGSAFAFCPVRPSGDADVSYSRVAGWAITVFILIMFIASPAVSATAAGTDITNEALATYTVPGVGVVNTLSNSVIITTVSPSTVASVSLLQYVPSDPLAQPWIINAGDYQSGGAAGPFLPMPAPPYPVGSTSPIDLSAPVPLAPFNVLHMGEPLFVAIDDMDQNTDPLAVDTVTVTITVSPTGESETIRLYETGVNTGIFTGFIQTVDSAPLSYDSTLSLEPGAVIDVTYTDANDSSVSSATLSADPMGVVFDSFTGAPVSGATVTLLDSATGLPAIVNGDDGVSLFPSSVVTGSTVTDSSGKTYVFAPGEFRFPYIKSGSYMLTVTPLAGYTFPSVVPDATLLLLPGSFDLSPASRGLAFNVDNDGIINVDIPIDPGQGSLFVKKLASVDRAAVGDHIQYNVTVDETSGSVITNAIVVDTLPLGFAYMTGSATINGASAPDPQISTDHRTLTYSLGDLAANASVSIKYVVEVSAGARPGPHTNSAYASGDYVQPSNTADAVVRVFEDLYRSNVTIMGRVLADSCGLDAETPPMGLKGVRVFLENGKYVVSDDKGMFHFEGVNPGTHVVQLDYATLPPEYEPSLCSDSTEQAGSPFSRFVDLQGGTLWRTDFHVALRARDKGDVKLGFESRMVDLDVIEFSIPVAIGGVALDNVRINILPPDDLRYLAGTSKLNGAPIADPGIIAGSLTFKIDRMLQDTESTIVFRARASEYGQKGKFASRLMATFDTPSEKDVRTPVLDNVLMRNVDEKTLIESFVLSTQFDPMSSELSDADKAELDRMLGEIQGLDVDHIFTFGHTDSLPLSANAKKTYDSNYELSRDRAKKIVQYLAKGLNLHNKDISYVGLGPDQPIADNSTEEGRKKNRRVEIKIYYNKIDRSYELSTEAGKSRAAMMQTLGGRGNPQSTFNAADEMLIEPEPAMPEFDDNWLAATTEGLEWVWPGDDYHPRHPSLAMAIKHAAGSEIAISINGQPLDNIYIEYVKKDAAGTKAVTVYKGAPLLKGPNTVLVQELTDGNVTGSFERVVHYSTEPVDAQYLPDKSRLVADGKTEPLIAVRLTDRYGHPARTGIMGEFSVAPPHQPAGWDKGSPDFMLEGHMRYIVGNDGIAYIRLAPTSSSGEATVTLQLGDERKEIKSWLSPEMRDWILVGFAEGTAGYATLEGNADALATRGHEDGLYTDGKLAFFAKGRIKGKWLLTMAYDSSKPSYNEYELYGNIDPDQYYTLYGDATAQRDEAISARKLYLKIESDKFYALFGDYDTGLTVTRLSRYSRGMNGFKSEYHGDIFQFRAFASDTSHAFMKDEIAADGTSGLYRLSRRNIVISSDRVYIEVRDRFMPDVVLESRLLSRHVQYDIDYHEGTLFFREPIGVTDDNFNPVYIVVDYESYDSADTSLNYGGRAAVSLAEGVASVGVTQVHEESVGAEGDLSGFDATIRVGERTEIKGEVASTRATSAGSLREGSAYLLEATHRGGGLNAIAYVHEQDMDFGLGQQGTSQSGLRRYGLDFSYEASKEIKASGSLYKQFNLDTGAEREFTEANIRHDLGSFSYAAGLRSVTDIFTDGAILSSDQVTTSAQWRTLEGRLILKAARDQSISGKNGNSDYPTRTALGTDYILSDKASLFAKHEYMDGQDYEIKSTRAGIKASPWVGASLNSSMERQFSENGSRVFSNFGLNQKWKLADNWTASANLEDRNTLREDFLYNTVSYSGGLSEDFTAISLGVNYARKHFIWRNRVELRNAESYDKSGLFSAINGEPRDGLGLSAALRLFSTDWSDGSLKRDMSLRLGFVHRPFESRWIILDRLDYISEEEMGRGFDYDTWRVVNNLNANYRDGQRYQVSLQYGSKYVRDHIAGLDYKGYTDLMGFELRYNINAKWDLGPRFSILHSHEPGIRDRMIGLSAGYSAAKNIWLSLGYNLEGFNDRDFSAANFTSEGAFFNFRVKFDQISAKDAVRYFTGN